jgi:hypothetical protein
MNITPEEAALSLQQIKATQNAMRRAIRDYRGHLYLWIWGAVWMATALVRRMDHPRFYVTTNWLTVLGGVASFAVGFSQARKVRGRFDKRFLAVGATLLVFGYGVWPLFFKLYKTFDIAFGYQQLLFMQLYIVGGIWFANSLLWVGLAVSAVTLVGLLAFPAYFWIAMLLSGATLIASGSYVRRSWR